MLSIAATLLFFARLAAAGPTTTPFCCASYGQSSPGVFVECYDRLGTDVGCNTNFDIFSGASDTDNCLSILGLESEGGSCKVILPYPQEGQPTDPGVGGDPVRTASAFRLPLIASLVYPNRGESGHILAAFLCGRSTAMNVLRFGSAA